MTSLLSDDSQNSDNTDDWSERQHGQPMASWTQASNCNISLWLRAEIAASDGSLAGSFAKLLAPLI
jgi:hypothetical protein